MKVLDLRCANGHGFEGWFASDDDYMAQNGKAMIACPMCSDQAISRMPSAPRLNLSGARAPQEPNSASSVSSSSSSSSSGSAVNDKANPTGSSDARSVATAPQTHATTVQAGDMQAMWLKAVRELMAKTEDVGSRFPEEARRIHYGEVPNRGIRGQASPEERAALQEEGIETMAIPVPHALKGPVQ